MGKKCKICENPVEKSIVPITTLCSVDCAMDYQRKKQDERNQRFRDKINSKEHKQWVKEKKVELRPLSWYKQKAQKACNEYIRLRDKDLPCVSCGTWEAEGWHAGHYRPSKNSDLSFHELNIQKQCEQCNLFESGNLIPYRRELERRIGVVALAFLEGPQESQKFTREDYEEIYGYYKAKAKKLREDA